MAVDAGAPNDKEEEIEAFTEKMVYNTYTYMTSTYTTDKKARGTG